MRHVERYPHNNLKALGTPSKSGHTLSELTVRKYLRGEGFFLRFKARKKPYLTAKHKKDWLRWGKERLCWTSRFDLYGRMRLLLRRV